MCYIQYTFNIQLNIHLCNNKIYKYAIRVGIEYYVCQ